MTLKMLEPNSYDVIVIGAGIAGASIAYELAFDRNVLVLEREEHVGYHSTGRSAAIYIPSYDFHETSLFTLTKASYEFLAKPPADFSDRGFFKSRGLVMVGQKDQESELIQAYEEKARLWPNIRMLYGEELRELVPDLSVDYGYCGIYEPDVFDIDVHALHDSYLRGVKRRGSAVRCNAVVQSIVRSDRGWSLETPTGVYSASVIVNAAGAWCDEIATLASVAPVGLNPLRRTAILVDPAQGADIQTWPVIADFGGRFYFKPDAGLLLASPADETPSNAMDAQPEELDVAYAAHFAEEVLGLQIRRVNQSWAGLRSFVSDRRPVIGPAADDQSFFWIAGQGGHGIQIAPAAARVGAALVRGESIPSDLQRLGFNVEGVLPKRLKI